MRAFSTFVALSLGICSFATSGKAQQMVQPTKSSGLLLWSSQAFSLYADSIVQPAGGTARAISATSVSSDYISHDKNGQAGGETPGQWNLTKDISAFPQYSSPYPLPDALYNMALEEMQKAIEPDSTFRTGKEWAGVWTRDISYSITLSMAFLQPQVARNSLMRKVNREGRIIQDTGTGGAWPVSSDRMIWANAAWELYKVTGDRDWLEQAYEIIKRSVEDDIKTLYDPATGLVRGESSFLDWREQTYPAWMQPADIFESENLGTNAVHYQANMVLAQMANILHHPDVAKVHEALAEKIKAGINRYFWLQDQGYYGQYRYGRIHKSLSPRSEALGEALSVIFGIAPTEKAKQVIASTPVMSFGIPCIYPQIPGIPPYHNKAVWPFVQTFWLWAAAKEGNEQAVMASIAGIYRPAALFLTNKENFVAETGDYRGTQINSSNMLWSLSGNLSIVYKVLFGMRFGADSLAFQPFVPKPLGGPRTLKGVHYRGAVLDIAMDGYGNHIRSFRLDGKEEKVPAIPATLTGRHQIKIMLSNNATGGSTNGVGAYTSPAAPVVQLNEGRLQWTNIDGAAHYDVYKNGQFVTSTKDTQFQLTNEGNGFLCEYQVSAKDKNGVASFLSEPVDQDRAGAQTIYEVEAFAENDQPSYTYTGFTGQGFSEISRDRNKAVAIPIAIKQAGRYAIDFRYANGNGPINTENKCAIRNLGVDGHFAGALVFPQRGKGEWSTWGFSNAILLDLSAGNHTILLSFNENDENMNGPVNQAMLDYLRLTQVQ